MTNLLDKKNSQFWNEPCGTSHYLSLINNNSFTKRNLDQYDKYYFELYPYLNKYIPFRSLKDKTVLEVGLGFGTVAQKIMKSGAVYTGIDIANGPVDIVKKRIKLNNLKGTSTADNILIPKLSSKSFDFIISIGCLHHTGNLSLAVSNCYKLLKKNGTLVFMVYNQFSYRRFITNPFKFLKFKTYELFGTCKIDSASSQERSKYDTNTSKSPPPHTDFVSRRTLKMYCKNFKIFNCKSENIDREFPFIFASRKKLLNTIFPKIAGLDLYVIAKK
jgi:2-polyprenyl-3-methyl-5-hydroxy-6-metoxy-1,4-benzoquinol methylase